MSDSEDTKPMNKQATAKYLNCSVSQLQNLVNRGAIPEGQVIGGRKKYWFKIHLDQYIARQFDRAGQSWSPGKPAAKTSADPTVKRGRGRPKKVVAEAPSEAAAAEQIVKQAALAAQDANQLQGMIEQLTALLKLRNI